MKDEYPNFYLYLSDCLRRDYFPSNLKGTTLKAKAPAPHTAPSFPSILSGVPPQEHKVNKFPKAVQVPTVFELTQKGYQTSLWDHPNDVTYKVFRFPDRIPLKELEEPFVFVHRDTSCHAPYCNPKTGNVISWKEEDFAEEKRHGGRDMKNTGRIFEEISGPEYIEMMGREEVDYKEHYKKAVKRSLEYFRGDIQILKEKGVYDRTFKVFTSDHGDNFADDERGTLAHGNPTPEVMNVAVNFFDHDVEVPGELKEGENFNLTHTLRVWDTSWDETYDSLEVKGAREEEKEELEEKMKKRLRELGYLDKDESGWRTFKA